MKDRNLDKTCSLPVERMALPFETAMTMTGEYTLIIAKLNEYQLQEIIEIIEKDKGRVYQ